MAYTRSQFVLNPNTAPTAVANAVGRSAIADAANAATNIIGQVQNLQGTKIQNESRELSMHTQILAAQAADDRRVIAEREAAAARAKAAADTDALQNYLERRAAVGLEYEAALRVAGEDAEAQRAARDAYVGSMEELYGVLPETVQDRVHPSQLEAVTNAESTYRSNLHSISVGQFNQQVESFALVTQGMGMAPDMVTETYNAMLDRGAELGFSRDEVASVILNNERNYILSTADWDNKSLDEKFAFVDQYESRITNLTDNDPYLQQKAYTASYIDTVETLRTAARAELEGRVTDAVDNLDKESFDKYLTMGRENGTFNDYSAGQQQLKFTAELIKFNSDPERQAQAAFDNEGNRGFLPTSQVYLPTDPRAAKYSNLVENQLTLDVGNLQDAEAISRIIAHVDGGSPEATRVLAKALDAQVAGIRAHLEDRKDPNTEEGQLWQAQLNERMSSYETLQGIGGNIMTQEQKNTFSTVQSLIRAGDYVNPVLLERRVEDAGNNIAPLNTTSNLGRWINENVSADDARSALSFGAALQMGGLDESQIKDIIGSSYTYTNLGAAATWSLPARDIMTANGIATPEVQKFAEEVLTNPDLDILPQEYIDRIQMVKNGENFRFITMGGMLVAASDSNTVSIPLTPEHWKIIGDQAKYDYDISQQSLPDQVKNYTSMDVTTEVGSVLEPMIADYGFYNSAAGFDAITQFSESLTAIGDRQTAAGEALKTSLLEGRDESLAADSYLESTLPNVMDVVKLQMGNNLTQEQYNQVEQFILDEGKSYLRENDTLFGRSTDGLFEHLSQVAIRYSGADNRTIEQRREASIQQAQTALTQAQEAYDNSTFFNKWSARNELRAAQSNLSAAEAGYKTPQSAGAVFLSNGEVVQRMGDASMGSTGMPLNVRIAQNNLAAAQAAVEAAQAEYNRQDPDGPRVTATRRLEQAQAELTRAQNRFDALNTGR